MEVENTGPNSIGGEMEASASAQVDPAQIAEIRSQLYREQNLILALIVGSIASLVGAAIWAIVTNATGLRIGWLAIGIGILVGFAVRSAGKGVTSVFGVVGAILALFGCVLGNLLSICGLVAAEGNAEFVDVVFGLALNPSAVVVLLRETFRPMDLLFYGLAVYEGYKFSFRELTSADLDRLT